MSIVLWSLAVIFFAEIVRFLHAEIQRRRSVDPRAFPADPFRAAVLTPASLESSDREETGRGHGLIIRVNLALASLAAASCYGLKGAAVLVWVGLAVGPAQLLFLVPALAIGIKARQARAVAAILKGSLPAFAISGVCFLWMMLTPKPAPIAETSEAAAAAAAPAPDRRVGDQYYSASLPAGWLETWKGEMGARWEPAEAGGADPGVYISLEIKPKEQAEEFFETRALAGLAVESGSQTSGSVGPLYAKRRRAVRSDPAGRREVIDRWVAVSGERGYLIECFGREGRLNVVDSACGLFLKTFQPSN